MADAPSPAAALTVQGHRLAQGVEQLELGDAGGDRPHPDAAAQTLAAEGDVDRRRQADQGAAMLDTLDREDQAGLWVRAQA